MKKTLKKKKILIFGGLGFIGRNLTAYLLERGAKVKIADRDPSGRNLDPVKEIKNLEVVRGDVLDRKSISEAMEGDVNVVFNLAAHSGPKASVDYPYLNLEVNVVGALNVLKAARDKDGMIVVFPGSRLEYGRTKEVPVSEDQPISPNTFYGVNKFAAGIYHQIYHRLYGVKTVVFRGANPYGPHVYKPNPAYNNINYFIDLAERDKTIEIYGEGEQLRDYIYVEDFCKAMVLGAFEKKAYGEIYNLGSGEGISLINAARKIVEVVGSGKVRRVAHPKDLKKIESGDYVTDITKIKEGLGWEPKTGFEEGVKKVFKMVRKERGVLRRLLSI